MLIVKREGIKYDFLFFGMTQAGIEPQATGEDYNIYLNASILLHA